MVLGYACLYEMVDGNDNIDKRTRAMPRGNTISIVLQLQSSFHQISGT